MFAPTSESIIKKRKKKLKKLKKKRYLDFLRRTHLIVEARQSHERNRKKAKETLAKGGWCEVATMEQEDLGFALGSGAAKAIVMAGNSLEKLKKRQRSLSKSKSTHLNKLKKARKKNHRTH